MLVYFRLMVASTFVVTIVYLSWKRRHHCAAFGSDDYSTPGVSRLPPLTAVHPLLGTPLCRRKHLAGGPSSADELYSTLVSSPSRTGPVQVRLLKCHQPRLRPRLQSALLGASPRNSSCSHRRVHPSVSPHWSAEHARSRHPSRSLCSLLAPAKRSYAALL